MKPSEGFLSGVDCLLYANYFTFRKRNFLLQLVDLAFEGGSPGDEKKLFHEGKLITGRATQRHLKSSPGLFRAPVARLVIGGLE